MSTEPKYRPRIRRRDFDGLTELENNFVAEYLVDMNATHAYVRAGYNSASPKQDAYKLRRKEHIVKAITQRMVERNELVKIDAHFVLTETSIQYREAAQRASEDPRERSHALKALDMLGKHVDVQAFRQQVGIGNPDGSNYDLSRLNDTQLDQLERLLRIAAGLDEIRDREAEAEG